MELPVVNHPDYVAKINDDNKFPIKKFGALAKYLLKNKIVEKFYIPKECSIETMKTSHSLKYINDIKNKTLDILNVHVTLLAEVIMLLLIMAQDIVYLMILLLQQTI